MTYRLTAADAALVKGMIDRGDNQHDIAASFGVNPGRIADVKGKRKFADIEPAAADQLPPAGSSIKRTFAPVLDPEAALDEQIVTLRLLILTTPPLSPSHVVSWSPGLANHVTKNWNAVIGHGNRSNRPRKIAKIQHDISRGLWRITGETIVFAQVDEGELDNFGMGLLDGQNRLLAIGRSERVIPSYTVFGVDRDAFLWMDVGANRTGSDAFRMQGVANAPQAAAASRWLMILDQWQPPHEPDRGISPSNDELWDYYDKRVNHDRLQKCIVAAGKARHGLLPVPITAAMFYKCGLVDQQCADLYMHDLAHETRGAKHVLVAIRKLKEGTLGRVHENLLVASLILGWNFYRENNQGPSRPQRVLWTRDQGFPQIR